MDLVVAPLEFTALLSRASLAHDSIIARDNIEHTWTIEEDDLERFWAASLELKNGIVKPNVVIADVFWFMRVRPLLVIWKPGQRWL